LFHFVSRVKEINQGSPTDTLPGLEGAIQLVRNNIQARRLLTRCLSNVEVHFRSKMSLKSPVGIKISLLRPIFWVSLS